MSKFNHEGTEDLANLADEVERERQEKGHTPFDDATPADGEDGSTREDHEDDQLPLTHATDATRAGIIGAAGRVNRPGI